MMEIAGDGNCGGCWIVGVFLHANMHLITRQKLEAKQKQCPKLRQSAKAPQPQHSGWTAP